MKNFAKNFAVPSDSSNHHALFGCHVERSETSLAVTYCAGRPDNQRFFASLRMIGNAGARLDHSEFHPSSLADHILVPGRIPNELHVSFIDAVDG
jgi:hypothetical protein